jgi:hypothetical protein
MKLKLITEMPLVGYHVNDNVVGKGEGGYTGFSKQSANALRAPKVLKKLTKVLDRSKYKIIIIADEGHPKIENYSLDDQYFIDAGIDPKVAKNAITVIISFDNAEEQHDLSPWIILHQLGEAAVEGGRFGWWFDVYQKYEDHLSKTPIARGREDMVQAYGKDNFGMEIDSSAFSHIFDMKSAREFIHGGFDNYDCDQELLVEYLWYGGNIRVNYPDWIDRKIVDHVKRELEYKIANRLDMMVGKVYNNDPQARYGDEED